MTDEIEIEYVVEMNDGLESYTCKDMATRFDVWHDDEYWSFATYDEANTFAKGIARLRHVEVIVDVESPANTDLWETVQ